MGQARSFLTLGGSFFGNQRIVSSVGLCGIGPALAGNVGAGGAFALSREGDQDVDVPMLAPEPIPLPPRGVVWGHWVDFEKDFEKGDDGLRCRWGSAG